MARVDDLAGRGKLLNSMNLETNRLIKLVNDLLVLTRSDAGALSLEIQSFDLGELIQTRCRDYGTAGDPESESSLFGKTPLIFILWLMGDPNRTAQVLDNLLNNALRYAPRESEIIISLKNLGGKSNALFLISGPGISPGASAADL